MKASFHLLPPFATTLSVEERERVWRYIEKAKSPNTLRAYRSDWRDFVSWCLTKQRMALPAEPETIALYLTEKAETLKVSTLERRLAAIAAAHRAARDANPALPWTDPTKHEMVRTVWQGIRREKGVAVEQKAPLLPHTLVGMILSLPPDLRGLRDKALLLLGFAGAFRRSELVGLDVEDLAEAPEGMVVFLRHSKTDPEGRGEKVGIPYSEVPDLCPVRAVLDWLEAADIAAGPLFRPIVGRDRVLEQRLSDRAVARIVKRAARRVGLPEEAFAGHSLRAGLITAAARLGVPERAIAKQSRHKSVSMLRRYIRDASLFRENAAAAVFHALSRSRDTRD